jgi:hypothetical protein
MARPVTQKANNRMRLIYGACATFFVLFITHSFLNSNSSGLLRKTARWTAAPLSLRKALLRRGDAPQQRPIIKHPIPKLMTQAVDNFESKLDRQSKTLEQAVAEYKKRYNMNPPKGFDDWFAFAKDNKVTIIDEYDQLMRDLEPWVQLTGEDIRRRCIQVGFLPSVDLVRVENGTTRTIDVNKGFDDSEVGARAKGFRVMLEKFQDKLPNMDFPINEKAEGRILVPWEESKYTNLTADSSSGLYKRGVCCYCNPDMLVLSAQLPSPVPPPHRGHQTRSRW